MILKVGMVQFYYRVNDKVYNMLVVECFCWEVVECQIKIFVFFEMCFIGYWYVCDFLCEFIEVFLEVVLLGFLIQVVLRFVV